MGKTDGYQKGTGRTDKTESRLKMQSISKRESLLFSFIGFRFFWNSPDGKAIPLLNSNPSWLAPLIVTPYMLASLVNIHNLNGTKYFLREEDQVVGTAILKVHQDTLSISALAVSPTKRKRGIGFFTLYEAEMIARKMRLSWLEVELLKDNIAAYRLYRKFGFETYADGRITSVLRKRV
jgi:ribosomal protein S18 acetylase RimI-like enzyme